MFSYSFNFIIHDVFRSMGQDITQGGLHILCIDINYIFVFYFFCTYYKTLLSICMTYRHNNNSWLLHYFYHYLYYVLHYQLLFLLQMTSSTSLKSELKSESVSTVTNATASSKVTCLSSEDGIFSNEKKCQKTID